jgi:hypothetical protein
VLRRSRAVPGSDCQQTTPITTGRTTRTMISNFEGGSAIRISCVVAAKTAARQTPAVLRNILDEAMSCGCVCVAIDRGYVASVIVGRALSSNWALLQTLRIS